MKVAIVYYSLSGKTRAVSNLMARLLRDAGHEVSVFEVRPVKEYSHRLAHINPRVIKDTLSNNIIEIKGIEEFNPREYDLLIIATPIWIGRITPPIRSFIEKFKNELTKPVICVTTSDIRRDYSLKFREYLESRGIKVVGNVSFVNLENAEKVMETFIKKLLIK